MNYVNNTMHFGIVWHLPYGENKIYEVLLREREIYNAKLVIKAIYSFEMLVNKQSSDNVAFLS